jgi:hypothetical protein
MVGSWSSKRRLRSIGVDGLHPVTARDERLSHWVKGVVPVVTAGDRVLRLGIVGSRVGWQLSECVGNPWRELMRRPCGRAIPGLIAMVQVWLLPDLLSVALPLTSCISLRKYAVSIS